MRRFPYIFRQITDMVDVNINSFRTEPRTSIISLISTLVYFLFNTPPLVALASRNAVPTSLKIVLFTIP